MSELITQATEAKTPATPELHFSVLTNSCGHLNKTISVDDSGKLNKSHPDPMYKGSITHTKRKLEDLPKLLIEELKENHALCHGIVKGTTTDDNNSMRIVVSANKDKKQGEKPGIIARTKKYITFDAAYCHLSMLDHDPDSQCRLPYLPPDALLRTLAEVDPQWGGIGHVVAYSTGSHIYLDDMPHTVDSPGYHLYFGVENPDFLSEYMDVVFKQTFINGHGWIKLARDGAMLQRSCFDRSVFSPERIDFTAPPTLKSDRLTQKRPAPAYTPGGLLDASCTPDVDEEEYQRIIKELKEDQKLIGRSDKLRASYIKGDAKKLAQKSGISIKKATTIVERRCVEDLLMPDELIYFQRYEEPVKARDVLANLNKYDGCDCCDPIEPEHGSNKAKFYSNTENDGRPLVRTFLHGGRNFYLQTDSLIPSALHEGKTNPKIKKHKESTAEKKKWSEKEKSANILWKMKPTKGAGHTQFEHAVKYFKSRGINLNEGAFTESVVDGIIIDISRGALPESPAIKWNSFKPKKKNIEFHRVVLAVTKPDDNEVVVVQRIYGIVFFKKNICIC